MNADVRTRVVVLVGLAVLAVVLAGVGTVLGVGGPIVDDEPPAEFTIAGETLTLSDDGEEVTVLENASRFDAIEIAEDGNEFNVRTEKPEPLTDRERERAKAIARENGTVQGILEDAREYELSVKSADEVDGIGGADVAAEAEVEQVNLTPAESSGDAIADGNETGDRYGNETGDRYGNETGDRYGNETGDERATLTADEPGEEFDVSFEADDGAEFNVTVVNDSIDAETVRIHREPGPRADAIVEIDQPVGDGDVVGTTHLVVVDLEAETVVSVH